MYVHAILEPDGTRGSGTGTRRHARRSHCARGRTDDAGPCHALPRPHPRPPARVARRRPARPGRLPHRTCPARLPRTDQGSLMRHHTAQAHDHEHNNHHDHNHAHGQGEHGHTHGVVDRSILVSAAVALYETILRFIHPHELTHLWVLAAAGVIGFLGNELAAQVRLRGGHRLSSPALIADGNHARVDGYVSLGVVASAIAVSLGATIGDPIVGLLITLVILKITWDSWRTVSTTEPGELVELREH